MDDYHFGYKQKIPKQKTLELQAKKKVTPKSLH
jgi:hypothetical protein